MTEETKPSQFATVRMKDGSVYLSRCFFDTDKFNRDLDRRMKEYQGVKIIPEEEPPSKYHIVRGYESVLLSQLPAIQRETISSLYTWGKNGFIHSELGAAFFGLPERARQEFETKTPKSQEVTEERKGRLCELLGMVDPIPLDDMAYAVRQLCVNPYPDSADLRFTYRGNCNQLVAYNIKAIQCAVKEWECLGLRPRSAKVRVMELVDYFSRDWGNQIFFGYKIDTKYWCQYVACDFFYQQAYKQLKGWVPEKGVEAQPLNADRAGAGDGSATVAASLGDNETSATGATVVCDTEEPLAMAARTLCAGHNGIIQGLRRDYPHYENDIPKELTEEAASRQLERDERISRRKVGRQWYVNSAKAKRVIDEKIKAVRRMDKEFADLDKVRNEKPQIQEKLYKGPNSRI